MPRRPNGVFAMVLQPAMPMLLRSTLIYAPAVLLTRISALLLLVIATRLVDQTEYGLLTLVVTVGEMTDVAMTNWLRVALLRLGGRTEISSGSLWLAGRVLIAATTVALIASFVAALFLVPERWVEFAIAVSGYLVASAVGRFALTVLQMQQRHLAYSMLEFVRAVLQLVLPIVAFLIVRNSFLVISLASSSAALLAGLIAAVTALSRVLPGPARFTYREFFALGVPLILLALVGFGLANTERLFLKVYYDAGAVAVFAAAFALARQPIEMIANAINIGAFPEVVSRFDEDGPDAAAGVLSNLLGLMLRLSLPAGALLTALAADITAVVLPPTYHGAVDRLFPIIAVAVIAGNVMSFVYGNVAHAHKRPWLLIFANGAGTIGTVTFSLLLIPQFAEVGAALALALGSLMALATCIVIAERLTPIPVPWRDLGISILIALGTGVAAALVSRAANDMLPIVRLMAGGLAGGATFLGMNTLFHPEETRALVGQVLLRFRPNAT